LTGFFPHGFHGRLKTAFNAHQRAGMNHQKRYADAAATASTLTLIVTRIDAMDQRIDTRFNRLEERMDRVEQRLDRVEERLDRVEQRLDRVEERLDRVEERLDRVEQHLGRIDTRLDRIEGRQDSMEKTLLHAIANMVQVMNDNHAELNRKIEAITVQTAAR